MKAIPLIAAALFAIVSTAHAGCDCKGRTGGMGAGGAPGSTASGNAAAAAAAASIGAAPGQSGRGGSYAAGSVSLVDGYQPWPEAEMRQFEKPRWVPYAGN